MLMKEIKIAIIEWVDATYLDASQCTDDIKDFAKAILRKAQEK